MRVLGDYLNKYSDLGSLVALEYLKKHNLDSIVNRILYEYRIDFGTVRVLQDVWIKLLDVDPMKMVEFYEDVYSYREVPHYEDLITMAILNFATGLAATVIYDFGKKLAPEFKNKLEGYLKQAETLLEYLIKAYATRKAYYFGKITREKFVELKDYLKKRIFKKETKSELLEEEFREIWNWFNDEHNLDDFDQIREELLEIIERYKDYDRSEIQHRLNDEVQVPFNYQEEVIKIRGIGASRGVAYGILKVIKSPADVHKVHEGDIAVFKYFSPDFVPVVIRCSGAIGLPECGGLTGHLAIVCRELGKPCVVRVNYEFSDGQVIYLNSKTGEIHLIFSTNSLRELINQIKK